MTNGELLKEYVKEHNSVLVLYQHYDDNETGTLPSIDEWLLHEEALYKKWVSAAEKEMKSDTDSLEKEVAYYHKSNRLGYIQSLIAAVADSHTRFWSRTDCADGRPILMPVIEHTKNLVWGIEAMGDVNFEDAGRVTNVLSFLWDNKRTNLCEVKFRCSA